MRLDSPKLIAIAVSVAALAAQPITSQPKASYSLTIRASRPEYRLGSQVVLEVITKNTSEHEIHSAPVDWVSSPGAFAIELLDAAGQPVAATPLGDAIQKGEALWSDSSQLSATERPILKPGGSRMDEIHLDALFNLKRPGKYTVQVHRRDENTQVKVNSNTITITIT
jgi:hypothetical protein